MCIVSGERENWARVHACGARCVISAALPLLRRLNFVGRVREYYAIDASLLRMCMYIYECWNFECYIDE